MASSIRSCASYLGSVVMAPMRLVSRNKGILCASAISYGAFSINPLISATAYCSLKAICRTSCAKKARQRLLQPSLLHAIQTHDLSKVKNLLRLGCNPNFFDNEHVSALVLATKTGNIDLVSLLIRYGATLDSDRQGNTSLHHAVRMQHLPLVELLLRYNNSINAQNNAGETPLHLACSLTFGKWNEEAFQIIDVILQRVPNLSIKDAQDNTVFDRLLDEFIDYEIWDWSFGPELKQFFNALLQKLLARNAAFENIFEPHLLNNVDTNKKTRFERLQNPELRKTILDHSVKVYKFYDLISLIEDGSRDPNLQFFQQSLRTMRSTALGEQLVQSTIRLAKKHKITIFLNIHSPESGYKEPHTEELTACGFCVLNLQLNESRIYVRAGENGNYLFEHQFDATLYHELEHIRHLLEQLDIHGPNKKRFTKDPVADVRWSNQEEMRTIVATNEYHRAIGLPDRIFHKSVRETAANFLKVYSPSQDSSREKIQKKLLEYMALDLPEEVALLSNHMSEKDIRAVFELASKINVRINNYSLLPDGKLQRIAALVHT
jgi:hypothetical protein